MDAAAVCLSIITLYDSSEAGGSQASWNARDQHMTTTLLRIKELLDNPKVRHGSLVLMTQPQSMLLDFYINFFALSFNHCIFIAFYRFFF